MFNKKMTHKFMAIFLVLIMVLIAGPSFATDQKYMSSNYTGYYEPTAPEARFSITGDFTKVAENEYLALYLKEDTLAIRILNKTTGYIWSSNLDQYKDERLNAQWRNYFESGITIEYFTQNPQTQDFKIEQESIQTDPGTKVFVTKHELGFDASISFGKSGIKLAYGVKLTQSGLILSLDSDSIEEENPNAASNTQAKKIVSVIMYPMLGSTKAGGQKGYFFIPDGDGALVNFKKTYPNLTSGYAKRYYGEDLGVSGFSMWDDFIKEPEQLQHPLYGIIHGPGHDALLVKIREGAENAELLMYPAGVRTDFYFITNRFILRPPYLHIINTEKSSMVMSKEINRYQIQEEIQILSGDEADYNGIAKRYRSDLLAEGILPYGETRSNGIPLHLDVLMSSVKGGLFFNKTIPMTTVSQLDKILGDLKSEGVGHVVAELNGLFLDTVTVSGSDRLKINKKLGTVNQYKALDAQAQKHGYEIAPFIDYTIYPYKRYAKVDMEQDIIKMKNKKYLFYTNRIGLKNTDSYFLNPYGFSKVLAEDDKRMDSLGINHLSLSLPVMSSNFGDKPLSRADSGAAISRSLAALESEKGNLYIYSDMANRYTLPHAKGIFGIDMASSLYPYITDTVPFTSLVYLGSHELFGDTLNTSGDPEGTRLRMVEWGIYPSFVVTHEDTSKLLYSENWWIVSARYEDWRSVILETYRFVNDALSLVTGEELVEHQVIEPGVVRTVYGNGVEIIVNYTERDYTFGNVTVGGKDYKVIP